MRYVVLYSDGIGGNPFPTPPSAANTVDNLGMAAKLFRASASLDGRDGMPESDGGPWADVIPASWWDGISYGDYPFHTRLQFGKRGGVKTDRI